MSSIMLPSSSGRVLAPPSPVVHLNAFCTRRARTKALFRNVEGKAEARVQQRWYEQVARRQDLTIRANAAAEGQGFASDAGDWLFALIMTATVFTAYFREASAAGAGSHLKFHHSVTPSFRGHLRQQLCAQAMIGEFRK